MRVIGIDPGYGRIGVAIIEFVDKKESLVFSGCIETDKESPMHERLLFIGEALEKIFNKYSPSTLGIETIFFNKNTKTVIGVAEARGLVLYLAKTHGCQIYEFGPQEIKVAVTGYGKSDKLAVIEMVKRLVPDAPKQALDDEYDAIAVGITCLAHYGRTK